MQLCVWDDTQRPPVLLGTLTQMGWEIVGDPPYTEQLLHRPITMGLGPIRYLDGWSNGYVSVRRRRARGYSAVLVPADLVAPGH